MIDIYSGVIFSCKFPKGDLNEKIHKVRDIIRDELKTTVHVNLKEFKESWTFEESRERFKEIGLTEHEYYLEFSTDRYSVAWTKDMLHDVKHKIEEEMGCGVVEEAHPPEPFPIFESCTVESASEE